MHRLGVTRDTLRLGDHEIDARLVLAAAMVGAFALDLWLGRGTTFSTDEIDWFSSTPGLDVHQALAPYNGHLILTTRLLYDAMFHVFGVSYAPFRALALLAVLATAWLVFTFARRRVGGTVALLPALILLVFGSDAMHVLEGNAILDVTPLALGIGALLALERDDARGDLAACALLVAAISIYSTGLAFIGGAAVLVAAERARWRRAWVVLIPIALYAAWFIWSKGQPANTVDELKLSNFLLAPVWAADSLGYVSASIAGLNYQAFETSWVALAGAGAIVLAVLGIRRGVTPWLLATIATPLIFWTLGAAVQSPPFREPGAGRYMLPGAVVVLLFAAEAARDLRFRRSWLIGIGAVAAFGFATNLAMLNQSGNSMRAASIVTRYDLAALEAAGGKLGASPPSALLPGFDPGGLLWPLLEQTGQGGVATGYLDAVAEFGSPAYSEAELASLPGGLRTVAVEAIAHVTGVRLEATANTATGCREVSAEGSESVITPLPPGGAVLESRLGGAVSVSRFGASPPVSIGNLTAGVPSALVVPADSLRGPWSAVVAASSVRICALGDGQK